MTRPHTANPKLSLKEVSFHIEPDVKEFLRHIGVGTERNFNTFWRQLSNRFGSAGEEVISGIERRERGESVDIYALKNSSLDLSLAIASQYWGDLYRNFLTWFVREPIPSPSAVLDIGCESGVLTCFYAQRFPCAHVVGIDSSKPAVQCATELASRLGLENVSFVQSDFREYATRAPGKFDLITATLVFKEALPFPDFRAPSFSELREPSEIHRGIPAMLCDLLADDGHIISVERCGGLRDLSWWAKLLSADMLLDWNRSYLLPFEVNRNREVLPLLFGKKTDQIKPTSNNDIIAFRSYADLEKRASELVFEGHAAEAFLQALNPKEFVRGVQATYRNGSGIERMELWTAGPLMFTFKHSNRGYRRIALRSKTAVDEMLPSLAEYEQERKGLVEIEIESYSAPMPALQEVVA
jgi:SAM-dependent methyltransferase